MNGLSISQGRVLGIHWTRGWVKPTVILDILAEQYLHLESCSGLVGQLVARSDYPTLIWTGSYLYLNSLILGKL